MRLRTVVLALSAGVATTLLVGLAVTEALVPTIAFSILVGLPVGLASGLFVGSLVLLALADRDATATNRHAATAVGVCGLVLLVAFTVTGFVLDVGVTIGIVGGAVVGVVLGVVTFVWLERQDSTAVHAVTSR